MARNDSSVQPRIPATLQTNRNNLYYLRGEKDMRYGLEVIPFGLFSDPRQVAKVAQIAEDAGWQGLWLWDHLVLPWEVGDPWITLAAVASATKQMKLITGVAPMPRYRPHLLARMLTSLDILSEGRLIFGTGLGVASDFTPFGETGDAKTRAAMADEGLDLLAKLWLGEEATHHGQFYVAEQVRFLPTPVQRPRIPVWIGGDSQGALRRAARWDGWIMGVIDEQCNVTKPPAMIGEQIATIRQQRNSSEELEIAIDGVSKAGDGALAREYADAGATWWFEAIFETRGSLEEQIERIKAGPPV
jgi:alkanesulfonate monooxygenase SsuD/methylene tetrahydromethanopterin reductase-like flavin-dependent oxidoreductase (luciferase family)